MSLRFISRAILAVLTLLSSSLLAPAPASAAPASGLTVSPLTFEVAAKPADQIAREVKIDSVTDAPITLESRARNFVASGETGNAQVTSEETEFSLSSWISIVPVQF